MHLKLFVAVLFFLLSQYLFAHEFRDSLTKEEIAWLDAHPVLKHTGNPAYLPYEGFGENGKHIGVAMEYLNKIEQMLGIKIQRVPSASWLDALQKAKNKEVDIISNYTNDDELKETHLISKPFIKSPLVIVKRKKDFQPFISDLSQIKGEMIALGKKYSFLKPIFEKYPDYSYVEVDTIENLLIGLSAGKYDAALVTLNIATYEMSGHGLRNLQITGRLDYEMELGFGVAKENEIFVTIVNKALDAIAEEEHQEISNKWTHLEVESGVDYRYIYPLLMIILFIWLFYFYRSYELNKKIAKSSARLSKLLKIFDEHVIVSQTDLDGNITYASEEFCRVVGYSLKEVMGKNHRIFKHPDNNPQIYQELWQTIKAGKIWRGLVKNRKKNGEFYWAETVITHTYDEEGKITGYMAIRHDISAEIKLQELTTNLEDMVKSRTEELQMMHRRQKAIFDSASVGIIVLENRVIKQLNAKACSMLGYSQDELIGGTTRPIYESNEAYEEGRGYYEIVKSGEAASWEQMIVRGDKSTFMAKVHLSAIDEKNPTARAIVTIDDITLEHKALEDIKNAKKIAEDAAEAKSRFLANMSHEIRTPMSAIMGMAYLVLGTNLDSKQREYLLKIENAAKNLLGIINDILDFSKIEANKMVLEYKEFYIQDIFEHLNDIFASMAQEKNLNLVFNINSDVPSVLIGDSLKLSQVLINLVGNAIKFTSKGEISISVRVLEQQNDSIRLKFEVQDSGIGLSDEQMKGLFEPFHQVNGSTTRTYGGTGLGLSICKRLVGMMDGAIAIESKLGIGSKFYFNVKLGLAYEQSVVLPQKGSKDSSLDKKRALKKEKATISDDTAKEPKSQIKDEDLKEMEKEFKSVISLLENFDAKAIGSAQNLAQKLYIYLPKEEIELMLRASSNFDFEDADRHLKKLAKSLGLNDFC